MSQSAGNNNSGIAVITCLATIVDDNGNSVTCNATIPVSESDQEDGYVHCTNPLHTEPDGLPGIVDLQDVSSCRVATQDAA